MTIFGPDLSHYQQGCDLSKVAAEGHAFVIGKISQGASGRDPLWPTWRDQARAHGLLVAGYHYVTTDDPTKQAANCKAWIGDTSIAVALDWEANGGNWANFTAVLDAFRKAGLNVRLAYAPRWYWQQQGSPDMSKVGLPLWSSRYPSTAAGAPAALYKAVTANHWAGYGGLSVALVQFSDAAQVAGMRTDCSAFNGSREQLAELLGYSAASPTASKEDNVPAPAPLATTYLADGRYRIAAKVESTAIGSALFAEMWISFSPLWGDATAAVTALDTAGNVLERLCPDANGALVPGSDPTKIANNRNYSYHVPAKAATVTIEGKVSAVGETEVTAVQLARPA